MASADPNDEDYDPSLVNTQQVYTQTGPGGSFSNPWLTTGPGGSAVDQYTAAGKMPSGEQLYTGPDGKTYKYTSQLGYIPYLGATAPTPPAADTATPPPGPSAPGPAAGPAGPGPTNGFPDLSFDFHAPGGLTGAQAVGAIPLPQFHAPDFKQAPAFQLPTWQSVKDADPGIDFRLNQGEQALQQSAAARGVLNGGGTLKDIVGYGQNLASNEYGNAAQRAWQAYNTNYQTQYQDPNSWNFASAVTAFQPQMQQYGYLAQSAAAQPQIDWQNAFNLAQQEYNVAHNNQLDKFNRYDTVAHYGMI